jgi:hypothetical protein
MTWLIVGGCAFLAMCLLHIVGSERGRRLAELEQRARQSRAAIEARARAAAQIPTVR